MLNITRILVVVVFALFVLSCSRSAESKLVGEWNCPRIDPSARVTYKTDHTYIAGLAHPRDGSFSGAGIWRIEGRQMISRDYERGESRAEILSLTRNELQLKGPDGIISAYQRLR